MIDIALVIDTPMSSRAVTFMNALRQAAPAGIRVPRSIDRHSSTIIVYGAGDSARNLKLKHHLLSPGNTAFAWDLGYWDRQDAMRLALNGVHPRAEHLAASPSVGRRKFKLRDDHNPAGFVMLVGLGEKTNKQYAWRTNTWEAAALARIHKQWPGVTVVHRLKRPGPLLSGCTPSLGDPIEQALVGARAVVCKHSNVAIDACVAGIPVYAEGGAAHALYRDKPNPSPEERADFLARLSWWEWRRTEAPAAWDWMLKWIKP